MADRVIFIGTLILAAVYFYATAQIPTLEIGDPLGPKAFPRLLGIGLLIAAGILLLEMLRAKKAVALEAAPKTPLQWRHYLVVGAAAIWTGIYFAVFEWLGYAIATSIYLAALTAYLHKGHLKTTVLTSLLFSFISYFLFTQLLGVTLARGILPF